MRKAVGVGSFSGTTAAAIRWVSKDGLGAVGRLLIGLAIVKIARRKRSFCAGFYQRLSLSFMGGWFENLFDDDPKQWCMYAVFIGSAGSIFDLSTALYPAYFLPLASLGSPAKEEFWEVAAQLLGLALGILTLETPGLVKAYPVLVLTWMSMRLLHLWLRYQSLSVLQFDTINLKRARMLVKALLKLYANEQYILFVNLQHGDFEVFVSFKVGATSMSVLRSVWQTYWLHESRDNSNYVFHQLAQSILQMEDRFEDFIKQLNRAGWDMHQINQRVPKDITIDDSGPV